MGKKNRDRWQAPPQDIILPQEGPLNVEEELRRAMASRFLPEADLHGMTTSEVAFEVDQLVADHPGVCVRVVAGQGTGAIARTVETYLKSLARRKDKPILGYRMDLNTHSFVVRTAD